MDATQEIPELPNEGDVPDLWEEAEMLEWAGISLGREETVRLSLALRQLVESRPLRSVRLFGKILGREGDYFVAEGDFKEGEPRTLPPEDSEAEETPREAEVIDDNGTNRHVYWVCSSLGASWEQLPDVTPAQIVAARQIRRFFTGQLNAPVDSFPAFPGEERHLLRAQIARIAAATSVAPKEAFLLDDSDDPTAPISANPDWEGWDSADLLQLTMWVHTARPLRADGRTVAESDSDEDSDSDADELSNVDEDDDVAPLREVTEDRTLGNHSAWTVHRAGTRHSQGWSRHSPVWLRSRRWPGAIAWASDSRCGTCYVGWGFPTLPAPFSLVPPVPPAFPTIPTEAEDPSPEEEMPASPPSQWEEGDEEDEEGYEESEGEEEDEDED